MVSVPSSNTETLYKLDMILDIWWVDISTQTRYDFRYFLHKQLDTDLLSVHQQTFCLWTSR